MPARTPRPALHSTAAPRRALTAAATAVAAAALLAAPAAHALDVSSGSDGLRMVEPRNTANNLRIALVDDAGTTRYRVEMSRFGGRGLDAGPGCAPAPGVDPGQGRDVLLCDRVAARVVANLGPLNDTFAVDPSFPDPIEVRGDLGDDTLHLGAGNDLARGGSGRDAIEGNGGDDDLDGESEDDRLAGGAGNDRLHANGGFDRLDGGDGDDALTANPAASSNTAGTMLGGPGTDSFAGNGSITTIDSRDGIAEQVSCGLTQRGFSKVKRVFAQAIVDLVDQPGDAELAAGGCTAVDRAPRAERTAAELRVPVRGTLRLRDGRVALPVRCASATACRGTATVRVGSGAASAPVRFAIAARRTETVRVRIPRAAASRVTARGATATVVLAEQGVLGARTEQTARTLRR